MKQYQAKIVSARTQQDLEDRINTTLAMAVNQGWQLHSQGNWFRNVGGAFEEWYKCTLIFEKEMEN